MPEEKRSPLAFFGLAAIYLVSGVSSVSNYGEPFPFLGQVYSGETSEYFYFADGLISLYLFIGILKRQWLTLWLLIAYNFLDSFNAVGNLLLLPIDGYARLRSPIPVTEFRLNTFGLAILLLLLNVYLYMNRRQFSNRSPYLF